MELRGINMGDLPLYEALRTDPVMMSELGGPLPRHGLREKLQRIVDEVRDGRAWYSVIVADGPGGDPAGTVCIWNHVWNEETISEIGWMVLPGYQRRGLASGAVRSILLRARSEDRWQVIHAFPGVTNEASNAICRKLGFSKVE